VLFLRPLAELVPLGVLDFGVAVGEEVEEKEDAGKGASGVFGSGNFGVEGGVNWGCAVRTRGGWEDVVTEEGASGDA